MKPEIVFVTPQMASDWLKLNTDNRPMRRGVVQGFKAALLRGEYIPTHQGICFSDAGVLLDGQHRLTAISELRDGAYEMLVVRGVSPEAFKVMDIGKKRTASDALKENPRLVEVARLAAVMSHSDRATPTPTMLIPFIDMIDGPHSDLVSFCSTVSKTWTSAPARLAAVVAIIRGGDADYIKSIYRAMVRADFQSMPPIAQALYRAQINGSFSINDRVDAVARFLRIYDRKNAAITRCLVSDKSVATSIIRETFGWIIAEWKEAESKKPAPKGAGKGNSQAHSITAQAR